MAVITLDQLPNDPGPQGQQCSIKDADLRTMLAIYDYLRPEVVVEFGICKGNTAKYILERCPYIRRYIGIDTGPKYKTELPIQRNERPESPGYLIDDQRFELRLSPNGTRDYSPGDLRLLLGEYADAVFIDADHSYRNVLKDTELAQGIVKPSGFILWHDYGNVQETTEAIDYLNKYICANTITHVEGGITCFQDQSIAPRFRCDYDFSYGLGPDCYNPSVYGHMIAYRHDPSKVGHETSIRLGTIRDGSVKCSTLLADKAEDPRLYERGGGVWCSFSDNPIQKRSGVTIKSIEISSMELESYDYGCAPEKNWTFFERWDGLFCIYDYSTVLAIPAMTAHTLDHNGKLLAAWESLYGTIRGGTPPIMIEPNRWLTIFHSSVKPQQGRQHYFPGAIIFDETFTVRWATYRPLWWTGQHIAEGAWDKYVIFPGSCSYDPGIETVSIAYGLSDMDCRMRTISMKDLLSCGYSL